MIRTPIMIVGAGPTGLMLSSQLHRYGAPHTIVDTKPGITQLSKALAVQARTLEQYRQLGIAEAAINKGFIAKNVRFIVNGTIKATVPFGEIGAGLSPYPYLFILEQSQNEALLRDDIISKGGNIQWGSEVVEIGRSENGYTGLLKRSDGSQEPFHCQYLVGCGGANSPVRHFLQMPFQGKTNEQTFFVADITLEMELDKHGLLLVINNKEFLAFFPMSGTNQYRAIGILPQQVNGEDSLSFDLLKKHIEQNIGVRAKVTGHAWHSHYRVHHRIADSFQKGNAFLVGDAAHIHSPAGGQGMNTGLGDAVNLGWKLAAVINGWSETKILESYNEERRPFGVQLVHTTDQAFTIMVSRKWFPRFIRTRILPLGLATVLKFNALRRLMFKTISQTRIGYRNSSLSDGSRSGEIRSGDRFPWFQWNGGNSFDWLSGVGYVILRFGGKTERQVPGWTGPVQTIDVEGAAAKAALAAGLPSSGAVVVRPDMHVQTIVKH